MFRRTGAWTFRFRWRRKGLHCCHAEERFSSTGTQMSLLRTSGYCQNSLRQLRAESTCRCRTTWGRSDNVVAHVAERQGFEGAQHNEIIDQRIFNVQDQGYAGRGWIARLLYCTPGCSEAAPSPLTWRGEGDSKSCSYGIPAQLSADGGPNARH